MRKKELKERYESLLIGHNHLLKESVKQDEEIKELRLRIGELEFKNQALKDALKIATKEPEVEVWKTALDRDIEQYILKEGEDEREIKFKYENNNKGWEQLSDGVQYKFEFENGYGASVIRRRRSYGFEKGLWELAVLWKGHLCYATPITDDVVGYLSIEEVNNTLDKIKELKEEE